jgi:Tfp pilus assembly protein PilO
MNNWTQEKIRQIVLLTIGTACVLGIIWFVAVAPLRGMVKVKADKVAILQKQIQVTQTQIQLADKYKQEVEAGQKDLQNLENKMARGDPYRWIMSYLSDLQIRNDVLVSDFYPPQVTELSVPPKVPYRAVSYTIAGAAYYHDFGAFVADLDNTSPFVRLKSLTLQSAAPGLAAATAPEKLNFRTEFVTLIKSPSTQP